MLVQKNIGSEVIRLLAERGSIRQYCSVHETNEAFMSAITSYNNTLMYTYPPPIIDMTHAAGWMISAWARISGSAKPVTTTVDVMKRPRSTGPDPSPSVENSSEPQCANIAFGSGATTKVKANRLPVRRRHQINCGRVAHRQEEEASSPTVRRTGL